MVRRYFILTKVSNNKWELTDKDNGNILDTIDINKD